MNIGIIGCYHQGLVAAVCHGLKGNNVFLYDSNKKLRNNLQKNFLPIFEPGLKKLFVKFHKQKIIKVCNGLDEFCKYVDAIFILHDTPINSKDESDLKIFLSDINAIIKQKKIKAKNIIIGSQIPATTSIQIFKKIKLKHKNIGLAYIPENLRLGSAIFRYLNPPLPVIGTNSNKTYYDVKKIMSVFTKNWTRTSLSSAEMLKHILNSFLGLKIVFINEINFLSKKIGIKFEDISNLIALEPRLSALNDVKPGLAFAGGTLARDLKTLKKISLKSKVNLKLINSIYESNIKYSSLIMKKIFCLVNLHMVKNIGIIGLSYKADTDTLRRSFSVDLINKFNAKKNKIRVFDINFDQKKLNDNLVKAELINSFTKFYNSCKFIVLMNNKKDYLKLLNKSIKKNKNEKIIFDTTNLLHKYKYKNLTIYNI